MIRCDSIRSTSIYSSRHNSQHFTPRRDGRRDLVKTAEATTLAYVPGTVLVDSLLVDPTTYWSQQRETDLTGKIPDRSNL
jgi:hypothetical protein